MNALYAFFRLTDDLADGPEQADHKRAALARWRRQFHDALRGRYTHRVHAALHWTVERYRIPPDYLEAVVDGAEADLEPVAIGNFDELYGYCYKVASVVGMACVLVWEFREQAEREAGLRLAELSGVAFQLTNILRDLGEDYERGRVYLPAEELERFNCPAHLWQQPGTEREFQQMMRFQTERARGYYRQAEGLDRLLTNEGRAIFHMMTSIYSGLLDKIERERYQVFRERIRTSKGLKLRAFATAWPVRWGWL